ncbi:unnamed protein product [Effrenium voratum]|uniref:Uncharacterized protein n=1 Tax=Effrenium voratum TaxID=2562239 RepID=A0AA36I1E7_9DINO|nr:unnamed protein product [Effrenium voratum]CAJ1379159.1 unnamed protein product [Effrenium voratum]
MRLLGPPGALQDFWAANHDAPWLLAHPYRSQLDLNRTIPIFIHGDDAESHRRRSFMVVSWGSLLVSGCSPFDSNMLVFAGDNAQCLHETYNVLNCWLCWSLTELLLGTFLDVDPFGSPIQRAGPGGRQVAGGWKAVLACHKGDEAYLQKAYNMVTTWNSESVCWRCGASKGANTELVYTTHGPNAPHRETLLDTAAFIEQVCRENPFVRLPGFHIDLLQNDWLHCVDLAIVPECAGSVPCCHRTCV